MARIHGRNGIVYLGIASSAALATPVAYLSDWTISFTVDKQDVTAMGDTNKIYVAGLPDASGDFAGFYDDASAQTYTAATDGLPRNFYLYPSTSKVTQYFWGTVLADFEVDGGVGNAVGIKSSWNASSPIVKVG